MAELIDKAILADELRAVSSQSKTVPAAVADAVAVVLGHVARRVGAELRELRATNEALASVIQNLPGRFAEIEARLGAMERGK